MLHDVLSRVEDRLKAVGLNATAASKKAGLSEEAIRNLRRAAKDEIPGRSGVTTRTIRALAPVLETSVEYLLNGTGEPDQAPIDVRQVPVISWVSAGRLRASHPVYEGDILRFVYVTDLPPGDWLALEVDGDSMNRIAPPGSTIVLNRNDHTLMDGKYYVFGNSQGEATFKRYRADPDRLQPFSTNPDHETHYIEDEMLTVGRVRRVITDLP